MPELPEVETVCRGLAQVVAGCRIEHVTLRRKDLRMPFGRGFAEKLAGQRITGITRRAKYLLFELDDGSHILAHLGMSGSFRTFEKKPALSPHDHVVIQLDKGWLIYNDPRRFGVMLHVAKGDIEKHELLVHLGPEPLSRAFTEGYLKAALATRKAPIKPVLMDQELVVGVGNIYASEALFLAGIDPRKPASSKAHEAKKLVAAIRKVLRDAIKSGGSSLRDFLHVSGETGYFQHRFNVYERDGEPCFTCHTPIQTLRQAGRSTFFCPRCQR